MKRPSIHQLEVFCRVVQLNSMARAAEDLRVAPSSVSMQIQELERRYRTRLLVRGPRRTMPTAAGAALYARVLSLLEGLDTVEQELSQLNAGERGTLRFATSRTIGAGVVRAVLEPFESNHPKVDVSYHVMASSQQAKTEVLEERAEFALVGRVGASGRLAMRPLLKEPLVVAFSPEHPLAGQNRLTLETLAQHVLMLREPPILGYQRIMRLLEQAGVKPKVVEFASTAAIKAEAVRGHGVSILPRTTIADEIASGALLTCSVDGFEPYRTVFVASLSNTPFSTVAGSFLRLIQGSVIRGVSMATSG